MTTQRDLSVEQHLNGLDALRGLAILLVLVAHFIPPLYPDFQGIPIWSFGGAGVLLFFYLSGFLIFRNVQTQTAGVFLTKRVFKLFPAYWGNIASILLLLLIFKVGTIPDCKTVFSNLLMIQEFTHSNVMCGVYWTLQIEVKFYLMIVIFNYCFGPTRIYWILGALLLLNAILVLKIGRGSTLITYLITFFPGIAAARVYARGWSDFGVAELVLVTGLALLNLLLCLQYANIYQSLYAILFAIMLAAVLIKDVRSSFFAFFGKISYSCYLYHAVIGYMIIAWMSDKTGVPKIIVLLVASVASVAVSIASFYLIEKPSMALGRRLENILPRMKVDCKSQIV